MIKNVCIIFAAATLLISCISYAKDDDTCKLEMCKKDKIDKMCKFYKDFDKIKESCKKMRKEQCEAAKELCKTMTEKLDKLNKKAQRNGDNAEDVGGNSQQNAQAPQQQSGGIETIPRRTPPPRQQVPSTPSTESIFGPRESGDRQSTPSSPIVY